MWQVLKLAAAASVVMSCAPAAPSVPATGTAPASLYARIPDAMGAYSLTERAAVTGMDTDSLFRFRDGSRTNVTVFVYDVPADVRAGADPHKWTVREGEKFRASQDIRRSRGQIAAYVLAFSDTSRLAGNPAILEHAVGSPTRDRTGAITVELQYVYLIDGKFVKVRATIPEKGWQQTTVPTFARALALRMAGGS